jgi:hypothetical protein
MNFLIRLLNRLSVVLIFAFLWSSCHEDPINWQLEPRFEWEGQSLSLEQDYSWQGKNIRFTNIQMYLSGLSVLGSDDLMHLFPQSEYLIDPNSEPLPFSLADGVTPQIWYGNVGVDPLLNDSTGDLAIPAWEYPNNHPLSATQGMYWSWKPGYIFMKLEGRIDLDNDGQYLSAGETFSLHPGLSPLYTPLTINAAGQGSQNRLVLKINMAAFLASYPLEGDGQNVHAMHQNDPAFPYAQQLMLSCSEAFYALEAK